MEHINLVWERVLLVAKVDWNWSNREVVSNFWGVGTFGFIFRLGGPTSVHKILEEKWGHLGNDFFYFFFIFITCKEAPLRSNICRQRIKYEQKKQLLGSIAKRKLTAFLVISLFYFLCQSYVFSVYENIYIYIYIYHKGGRGHGVGSGSTVIQLYNLKIMRVKECK